MKAAAQNLALTFASASASDVLVARHEGAGDGGNDRVHPVHHFEVKLEPVADEAFALHVPEQSEQRVPEAVDIGEHDRLLMLLELRPGELLDELLQRAEAARQAPRRRPTS